MLRVGLTGGIGSGKSSAARYLASLGAVVVDADVLAREVVAPGSAGLAEIVAEFGSGVIVDGALDRAALAARVFGDERARLRLEAITHRRIRARAEALMAAAGDAIVVNDVPLLVESGLAPTYHLVVVVEADRGVRLERLLGRGVSREAAEARMAVQADDGARRAVADVVVDNSGGLLSLYACLDSLWERLARYELNIRSGTAVRRSGRLLLIEPDPQWPSRYARLAARIRYVVGDDALTLDHIGSTAVAGLPAKDVIDMQLGVRDAGTADVLAGVLSRAGFPPYPGTWTDVPKPLGSMPWPKRLHGSADPGRLVNLHVRVVGSPGWRWALLFRDWLRAQPQEAAAYAGEKARLVAAGLTVSGYAGAKEAWFDEAHHRAESWASATRWSPGT